MFRLLFDYWFSLLENSVATLTVKCLRKTFKSKLIIVIVKSVHACLTLKFFAQPSSAECGGLETDHKDSRQMFQHSDRMFEQIFQISFKISCGA